MNAILSVVKHWPLNYLTVWTNRQNRLMALRAAPDLWGGAFEHYRTNPIHFINDWCDTYDPRNAGRNKPSYMPFILFPRQIQMIEFLQSCLAGEENGLIEKARDMGATWVSSAFSVWLWRFYPGAAVGWGSRKEQLVDKLGDPDSIFEKMRIIIRRLPREFWPCGFIEQEHMAYMRIINPETGSTITGEAGDNIGRGGRKLIYFKDESAHYERPEKIEASLSDNTRVQIDISSVNGLGNVFHRKREAGEIWTGGTAIKGKTNVFIMDWRDHPAKTNEWYETRKTKAEADGLSHIFAQEVDRNYAAAVAGVIIPADWVNAAIDAHVKLNFEATGTCVAGLDVADEGGDKNALALRKGAVLLSCDDWGEGKTYETTNRAVVMCEGVGPVEIQYDSVGVGAGVKSEAHRLKEAGLLQPQITFQPWSAGAGVQNPEDHVDPNDKQTPLNKDMYANLKAQAWWELRRRFERTYRAVTEGVTYSPDELISLPSTLPKLRQLQKELSQSTAGKSTSAMKLIVNKTPEGTRSPNLADSVVMAYYPVIQKLVTARMW